MKSALRLSASPLETQSSGFNLALQATHSLRRHHHGLDCFIRGLASYPLSVLSPDYLEAVRGHAFGSPAFDESDGGSE